MLICALKVKGCSYMGSSTPNNITLDKDTTVDGMLTTGDTTITCDLAVDGNVVFAGDDAYISIRR